MKNPIKLYHIKANQGGVMTVATKAIAGGLAMSFAFCNPKDRFVRRIGAVKALGRLNSNTCPVFWTDFTGHSADDLVRFFNFEECLLDKPQIWKHRKLANVAGYGLTVLEDGR